MGWRESCSPSWLCLLETEEENVFRELVMNEVEANNSRLYVQLASRLKPHRDVLREEHATRDLHGLQVLMPKETRWWCQLKMRSLGSWESKPITLLHLQELRRANKEF